MPTMNALERWPWTLTATSIVLKVATIRAVLLPGLS